MNEQGAVMQKVEARNAIIGMKYKSTTIGMVVTIMEKIKVGSGTDDDVTGVVVELNSALKKRLTIKPNVLLIPISVEEAAPIKSATPVQPLEPMLAVVPNATEIQTEVSDINTNQSNNPIAEVDMPPKTNTEKASVKKTEKAPAAEKAPKTEKVPVEKTITRSSIIDAEIFKATSKTQEPDFEKIATFVITKGAGLEEDRKKIVSQAKVRAKWYKDGTKPNPAAN